VRQRLSTVGEDHMSDVLADWPLEDRAQLAALLPRFVDGLRGVPFRSSLDEMAS
jgi:hypothetical protein